MWREAWAKAPRQDRSRPDEAAQDLWLPLHTHLTDSAGIASLLCQHWSGPSPLRVIGADVGGPDAARQVVRLAAALHDVGKLTPAFAGQVDAMRTHMEAVGFRFSAAADPTDARALPHGVAGQVIIQELLVEQGASPRTAEAFAVVVGGHHGVPPTGTQLNAARDLDHLLGGTEWRAARRELIGFVVRQADLQHALTLVAESPLSDASQAIVTGLVIMADWIASNAELLPLVPRFKQPSESTPTRVNRAWGQLGLSRPWRPASSPPHSSTTDLLRGRFDKMTSAHANEVQELAVRAAREMPEPGLLIIEAVMGVGKTEASLLAAEILAERFGLSGLFYGLPTRATADAMFHRIADWLAHVPDRSGDPEKSVVLRHGLATMNPEYLRLPHRRTPNDVNDDWSLAGNPWHIDGVGIDEEASRASSLLPHQTIRAVARGWASGRKKAALAEFTVATIDHELLAALAARHVVLRHLGLSRQIVVLDEVHAADVWMSAYLERALEWLGRYRVPVIALSATLPPAQRTRLTQAYERGRTAALAPSKRATDDPLTRLRPDAAKPPAADHSPVEVPVTDAYPVLTSLSAGRVTQLAGQAPGRVLAVEVAWLADTEQALVLLLRTKLSNGGCALVVCNTVRRAIERYQSLRESFGDAVTLAHSRFIAADRLDIDSRLRGDFGPPARDASGSAPSDPRRDGRIVVATQVAEQSLDVDFDLLVTDLAPIDLVLQRMGRLHRHDRGTRPAGLRRPRCWVTGIDRAVVPVLDSGAVHVYGKHLLFRSAALIDGHAGAEPIRLPVDVPRLVRVGYGSDPLGPAEWQQDMRRAADLDTADRATTERTASTYRLPGPGRPSLVNWLQGQTGEADSETDGARQVRRDDGGFEVILLERADDGLRIPRHRHDDRSIPTDTRPDRPTAHAIAGCIVRMPGWITTYPRDLDAIFADLNANYYRPWQGDPLLAGQLVLVLDERGVGSMGPFTVHYDPTLGLEITREFGNDRAA
mgnify:CR=1 FL=1